MTATIDTKDTGEYVLINGIEVSPRCARVLARKLIECAHECDKRRRRAGMLSDSRPKPTSNPQDKE